MLKFAFLNLQYFGPTIMKSVKAIIFVSFLSRFMNTTSVPA